MRLPLVLFIQIQQRNLPLHRVIQKKTQQAYPSKHAQALSLNAQPAAQYNVQTETDAGSVAFPSSLRMKTKKNSTVGQAQVCPSSIS